VSGARKRFDNASCDRNPRAAIRHQLPDCA
jgi:hypothetical protein